MTRTLILGASGFLGAHVVASAVRRARREATMRDPLGPPVIAHSRGESLLVPRFCDPRDAAEWVRADLADPGGVKAFLDGIAPTEVVNCAALSRAADCEREPAVAGRLNAEMPGAVAAWCAAAGARLVHVSTDLVFGAIEAPAGGLDEESTPAPVSVYGRTKLEGEEAVRAACPDAAVVRLPLLYGNSGARGLGASDAILEAVERDERPRLFHDEWRTPLSVAVAADALAELLEFEGGGVLHVAGPDRVSRYELGLAVLASMGMARETAEAAIERTSQDDLDAGAPRPRDVSLNAARARELLDTELLGIREGLARAHA